MRLLTLFVLLVIFTACSGKAYKVKQPDFDASKYTTVGADSVTATGIHLFSLIPIQLNDRFERACSRLMATHGGDALTEVTVQESWFWAYVLNGYKTTVSATVLKKKEQS